MEKEQFALNKWYLTAAVGHETSRYGLYLTGYMDYGEFGYFGYVGPYFYIPTIKETYLPLSTGLFARIERELITAELHEFLLIDDKYLTYIK